MSRMTVEIDSVSKTYDKALWALREVDLQIGPGLFGLLGPNGAGKTTLLRLVATLIRPTTGKVLVDGVDAAKSPETIRRMLGYLPQEFGLYPRLSAREHMRYFASLKGATGALGRDECDRLLEDVGLAEMAGRRVREYSQGMKQRLGIALALIGSPRLLVVDEPTAGLDPEERVRFRSLLSSVARESVVILSTHIVQDVEIGCSRVAVVSEGRIVADSRPEVLVSRVEGRVWSLKTDESELEALRRNYAVMSVRRDSNGHVEARLVGASGPHGATPVAAQLEDAYVDLLHGGDQR